MLPIGSIFFSLRVAAFKVETYSSVEEFFLYRYQHTKMCVHLLCIGFRNCILWSHSLAIFVCSAKSAK